MDPKSKIQSIPGVPSNIPNVRNVEAPPAYSPPQPPPEEEKQKTYPFSKSLVIKIVVGLLIFIIFMVVAIIYFLPSGVVPGGKVKLVYWGVWEDEAIFNQIFDEFEKKNPNVEVVYEKQDIKNLKNYVERLSTRIQNNQGPDIFRFHNSWLFMVNNLLLPLPSDVVSSTELDKKFYQVVSTDLNRNGAYFGVPLGIDTLALFVNNEIFEASGITSIPATWDEFIQISRQLTVKDESGQITTSGASIGSFDNVDHATDIVSMLFLQNGADLYDLAGSKKKNAADALDFYTSFARIEETKVWDDTFPSSKLSFSEGRVAMYFGYSWDIFEIKKANPNLSFSVVPVPHVSGINPERYRTVASYWVEGVSARSKNSREAFELLKFLGQKDTLEKLYQAQAKTRLFGEPYPRTDMQSLLSKNELVYTFVKQAENASSTIFSADTHDGSYASTLNAYLANAIRSNYLGSSSLSAIETLASGVLSVYGE